MWEAAVALWAAHSASPTSGTTRSLSAVFRRLHGFGSMTTQGCGCLGKRNHSLGVRWFNADEFDPNNIPPIEIPNAKPVYCIERKQHFRSTADAEVKQRKLGFKVSASKITSVIKGKRVRAGGFTWRYSEKTTEEILNQPFYEP